MVVNEEDDPDVEGSLPSGRRKGMVAMKMTKKRAERELEDREGV